MSTLTLRASGSASADLVWERYADTRLWPTWSPQIRRVELDTDDHRLRAGLTGRVVGPFGVHVPFEVDSVDAAALTWVWRVRVGPVRMRLLHTVMPQAGGAVTTLTIEAPAPMAVGYSMPARLALHRLVRP